MRRIFIGFLFIFLSFEININSVSIGLIPSFVGYFLMLKGLDEMAPYAPRFARVRIPAFAMGIYTLLMYIWGLLGFVLPAPVIISTILGAVGTAAHLYITYHIVTAVREMEQMQRRNLAAQSLWTAWVVSAVFRFLPYLGLLQMHAGFVLTILALLTNIYFLYRFSVSKNLFYTPPADPFQGYPPPMV